MKRRPYLLGMTGIALSAALIGCSTQATPDTDGAAAKDLYVIGVNALPAHMSPFPWGGGPSLTLLGGMGSTLFKYTTGATDEETCDTIYDELEGVLAESAEVNEDGTAITVKLRDLKSQTGNELSAEDVRWSLEIGLARNPVMQGSLAAAGYDIENIATVVDEKTVQLNLKNLWSFTLVALQNPIVVIYDSTEAKKHVTDADPYANEWLGKNLADYSGWILDEFVPESSLRLTADPDWGGERGSAKQIEVKAISDNATRAQLLRSGEIDIATSFEYSQYEALGDAEGVFVTGCASANRDTLMFNIDADEVSDPRVRRAISMALDREGIIAGAYGGYAKLPVSIFPPASESDAYEHNIEAAKKLLAEAGYPDGFPMTLTYSVTRPGPVATKTAILVQSQLGKVGIDVELNNMASGPDFATALKDGRFQAVLYSEPLPILDPAFYTFAFYDTNGSANTTGWSNPAFDALRLELASTPMEKTEERSAIIDEMAALVNEEAPILSLAEPQNMMAVREGVKGATPLNTGGVYFRNIGG